MMLSVLCPHAYLRGRYNVHVQKQLPVPFSVPEQQRYFFSHTPRVFLIPPYFFQQPGLPSVVLFIIFETLMYLKTISMIKNNWN